MLRVKGRMQIALKIVLFRDVLNNNSLFSLRSLHLQCETRLALHTPPALGLRALDGLLRVGIRIRSGVKGGVVLLLGG